MADLINGLLGYMKDPRRSQQMQGLAGLLTSANDRARAFNQLNREATDEFLQTKDIYGPKAQQVANVLANAYNPAGITAYHAGPNLFSKFDVKRAPDTGSAYTQGAYAAAARREAEGKYLPRAPQWEEKLMGLYKQAEKSKDYESMEVLESALLYKNPKQLRQDFIESGEYSPEFAKKAEQTIKKIESVPRDSYLYKLDIADEALPNYMLFDKPLSQQPKQVQEYAKELGIAGDEYLGGDIVGKLRAAGVPELQIQETLRKRGIPGLIYDSPDVPGSINYVTYDPDLIKILEINDMPASGLLGQ
jgi:hypothetical protein